MALGKPNRSAATLTRSRAGEEISPFSGMCVTCLEGCPGLCEIGRSAYRGAEAIYPQPFGSMTAAAQKDYPCDFSHLTIMGTAVGAVGVEADPDKATFTSVNLETKLGRDKGIRLRLPIVIPGLGSTDVAKKNWDGISAGAALAGAVLTIGENVCGMDEAARVENGRVVEAPDLSYRVKNYREWQQGGYGEIVVQANVEDTRLGVLEYAIKELGVRAVELKWGQGAKDIGGEVKINSLEKAQMLKKRGYIVLPDPFNPQVIESFQKGFFKEFERHSRIGMVEEKSFLEAVEKLRKLGAEYVFLKTGAYRPADLARAVKFASEAEIDVLTVDGAGGGTGMSPWRMMNEWGIPTLEIASLTIRYMNRLASEGKYLPDLVLAGGFTLEDRLFKALALGAPYCKAVGMARAPIAAVMVGKTIGTGIAEGKVPSQVARYGRTLDEIFVQAAPLRSELDGRFDKLPAGALGLYTYFSRLSQGLRQLMCGARKFALEHISRNDLACLTPLAAEVTGIPYVMDIDREEVEKILP